MSAGNF